MPELFLLGLFAIVAWLYIQERKLNLQLVETIKDAIESAERIKTNQQKESGHES